MQTLKAARREFQQQVVVKKLRWSDQCWPLAESPAGGPIRVAEVVWCALQLSLFSLFLLSFFSLSQSSRSLCFLPIGAVEGAEAFDVWPCRATRSLHSAVCSTQHSVQAVFA